MSAHILDRPVWATLTGRQAHLAVRGGGVIRMQPDYGLFAALPDQSPEALAALGELVRDMGPVGLVELAAPPPVPGTEVVSSALCLQMVAETVAPAWDVPFDMLPLGDADAAEMLALATLTKPGPFFARTHQLGAFIGVRVEGQLVAMAGERMRPDGYTEASGVCVHPDHRGKGYAARLLREVTARILDRGDKAFLHSYADNATAIGLYESLGYRGRAEVVFTVMRPAE
ncbi:GNAT family N-acetyltransferase [Caulobacter segnis]|uniref:GCN5-related N-acetyltransferase n=2 Tax=Caulobacter segnis TaxID=88688 RepID=D5VII6_CAUST|nr:GNAT family N-acetyltransferase [Caulobacter segnis]ADG09560.1 GCN5-related N-acetyltransferase [Caulobacter segnis ATCC 21756]AVQ01344.1 GNAT family N-acetyltransferase [Caulobacter segnis]